jgi:GR25 family glycosyltransferase involved in LPS biosynthesis
MSEKLLNFPKIYYINLDRSEDRNLYMINQFKKYNILNYERVSAIDKNNYIDLSFLSHDIPNGIKPVDAILSFSHMKALDLFLQSGEEWAVILEDDADLSTIDYWNFSWSDLFKLLPNNLNILQMIVGTRTTRDINFHLHTRSFWDFCATGYLINKKHAKKIINTFYKNTKIDIRSIKNYKKYDKDNNGTFFQESYPTTEEVIYGIDVYSIYSIPIFTYTMQYESLCNPEHYSQAYDSRNRVVKFWSQQSKYLSIEDLMMP